MEKRRERKEKKEKRNDLLTLKLSKSLYTYMSFHTIIHFVLARTFFNPKMLFYFLKNIFNHVSYECSTAYKVNDIQFYG